MLSIAARKNRRDVVRTVVYLAALALVIFLLLLSIDYLQRAEAGSYGSIPEVGPAAESAVAEAGEAATSGEMAIEQTFTEAPGPEPAAAAAVVPTAAAVETAVPELGEGGHIYIPAIGVDLPLNVMASTGDQPPLDRGPSWMRQTGRIGSLATAASPATAPLTPSPSTTWASWRPGTSWCLPTPGAPATPTRSTGSSRSTPPRWK